MSKQPLLAWRGVLGRRGEVDHIGRPCVRKPFGQELPVALVHVATAAQQDYGLATGGPFGRAQGKTFDMTQGKLLGVTRGKQLA
jgi:hypothetical protein